MLVRNLSEAPIYTDPTLQSFKAAGFNYGFRSLVNLNSLKNAINLYKNGHRQGAFDNDTGIHWQLGGILVVKSDSTVGYHYISESLGDFSPENDFG